MKFINLLASHITARGLLSHNFASTISRSIIGFSVRSSHSCDKEDNLRLEAIFILCFTKSLSSSSIHDMYFESKLPGRKVFRRLSIIVFNSVGRKMRKHIPLVSRIIEETLVVSKKVSNLFKIFLNTRHFINLINQTNDSIYCWLYLQP